MASIHGPLKYKGDIEKVPFDFMELTFLLPKFEYNVDDKLIRRVDLPPVAKTVGRSFEDKSYGITFPDEYFLGENTNAFISWGSRIIDQAFSIDSFKIRIPYSIFGPDNISIVQGELNALFCFDTVAAIDAPRISITHQPELIPQLTPKLMIIVEEAFHSLLKKIQLEIGSDASISKELYLLLLIRDLHKLSGDRTESIEIDDQDLKVLYSKARRLGITLTPENIQQIVEALNKLVSFPIEIEKISQIIPEGTFHIVTPENTYPRSELSFYRISVEAVVQAGIREKQYRTWNIDWTEVESDDPVVSPLPFELKSTPAIIGSSVKGKIQVRVIGFNGTILWRKNYKPDSDELNHIEIIIDPYLPGQLSIGKSEKATTSKQIRGQVLSSNKSPSLGGLTVIIQAKKSGDTLWRIISGGKTGSSGHFSLNYPKGKFIAAQALVSIAPDSTVDLDIVDTGVVDETISDSYLFLLVDGYTLCDDAVCPSGKVSRLPDHTDLINSDEYTQDLGGQCVNVTKPNRTLREYSYNAIVRFTDPDVANYTLEKTATGFKLTSSNKPIERAPISHSNPVRWQDAPEAGDSLNFYQAVTVATGHILFYKVVFKADGYSLGDLVYSLPLAPGQKKQIVSYDMANTLEASETQRLSQGERLAAELLDERTITDELSGGIRESLQGRSSASTAGISAGLGLGVSMGKFGGSLGVAGGYSNANSSASGSGARNISQSFAEKLRQALMQNAESYRELNASVVTTVKEGQEYSVTTEVIANHNHCHSVTMMFFEVLRHFAISQELSDVQECVFVPLLLTEFNADNISKWKDVLATNLLPIPSNTYLQPPWFMKYIRSHPLAKAFDANERIKTDYARVDYPEGMYAEDEIVSISGEIRLRIRLPRPRTGYDRIMSMPVVARIESDKIYDEEASKRTWIPGQGPPRAVYRTTEEEIQERKNISDQFIEVDSNFQDVPPAQAIRVKTFAQQRITFEDGNTAVVDGFGNNNIDKGQWEAYANILGEFSDVYDMMDKYFAGRLIAEWDSIFNQDIAPLIFKKVIDSIKIDALNLDITPTDRYKGGERSMRLRISGGSTSARKDLPTEMRLYSNSEAVHELRKLANSILIVENVRVQYNTAHFNGYIFTGYVGNDLLDEDFATSGVTLQTPLTSSDKRNPRLEDEYLVEELFQHLNSNLEYYNKVLWRNLDPDRRYMLLDGFSIQTFDHSGVTQEFRSLASVVKNDLITVVGNSLVFPVAEGYHVSQTHIIEDSKESEYSLLAHYRPYHEVEPYRLSVPTRGVYMEAVMGQCDACEDVKEDSSQDWDRFRTEEPTAISPVTTPTPTRTDWRAIWAQFAQPLVALQTPREMPAPGAGLAGLSEALTKADAFRDITGLASNQENVIRTYLSNQENAKAFAEMAKTMAMQEHNSENSRSIMQSLDNARERGAISDNEYSELVRDHLGQQIDGGQRRQAEERRKFSQEPSLTNAAIEAIEQGREVNALRTSPDGTVESTRINAANTGNPIDPISYNVQLMPQPTERSCWAAAMAMIENYRRAIFEPDLPSLTVEEFVDGANLNLDERYSWNDLRIAKDHYGFDFIRELDGTMYPGPAKWRDWLRRHGPLYVSVENDPTSHAIVVHGISGNLTTDGCMLDILDPYPPNEGTPSRQMSVQDLNARFSGGDLSHLEVYDNWRILFHPDNAWTSVEPTGTRERRRPIVEDPRDQDLTYYIPSVFAPNCHPENPIENRELFLSNLKNIVGWIAIFRSDGGIRVTRLLNNDSNFDDIFNEIRENNWWGELELRLRVTRSSSRVIERLHFFWPNDWATVPPAPEWQEVSVRIGVASYFTSQNRLAITKANLRNVEREYNTLVDPNNNHLREDHSVSFDFNLRQSILGQFEESLRVEFRVDRTQEVPQRGFHISFYDGINSQIQHVLMPGYLESFPDDAIFEVQTDLVLYLGTNPLICAVIGSYARVILPQIPGTLLPDQRTIAQRIWDFVAGQGASTAISAVATLIESGIDIGTGVVAAWWDAVQMTVALGETTVRPLWQCFANGYFDNIGYHPPVNDRYAAYAGSHRPMQLAMEYYDDGWRIGNEQREAMYRHLWTEVLVPRLSDPEEECAAGWDPSYTDFLNANEDHRFAYMAALIRKAYPTMDAKIQYIRGVMARDASTSSTNP